MKCFICNKVQGNKVGMFSGSGVQVCFRCIPKLVKFYTQLQIITMNEIGGINNESNE